MWKLTLVTLVLAALAGCNPCVDEAPYVPPAAAPEAVAQPEAPAEAEAPATPAAPVGIAYCPFSTGCPESPARVNRPIPRTTEPGPAPDPTGNKFGPVTY